MAVTTLTHQETVSLQIQTPLAANVLTMRRFEGNEQLSKPFMYRAELVSENPNLSFDDLVSKLVTVSVDCHGKTRYFNGIVGEFSQSETARSPDDDQLTYYQMTIHPIFWMLRFTQDCRIFQFLSPMAIVKKILSENGVYYVDDRTKECGNDPREYCVQYNESHFDFISRLLEEEGIFYYFRHESDHHTIVFGDSISGNDVCDGAEISAFEKSQWGPDYLNSVVTCQLVQRVVAGEHSLADYNFRTASTPLYAQQKGVGTGGLVYGYPGIMDHEDRPTGARILKNARLRIEGDDLPHESITGTTTIPFYNPGFRTTLSGHARAGANREYVLYSVNHVITIDGSDGHHTTHYKNSFQAFPSNIPFRSPLNTPKPRIYSTQTARVTGPPGEEIWTDQYGCIKVKFHWDLKGPVDQNSSCWIRVSEGWAGNNWGIVFTPRVGMEVVVTFLDGNPDRPLVIGCVYNSDNMPPYLPEQPTKSTIKSNSTKGGDGFNEIRFDDLKGSEQLFVHAQKDMDLRTLENVTNWIQKGSYWWWIDRGNREVVISGDDHGVPKITPPGQNLPGGVGDDNLTIVRGSRTMKLLGQRPKGNYNIFIVEGDRYLQIDKGNEFELHGAGDFYKQLDKGNHDTAILKGDHTLMMGSGNHHTFIGKGNINLGLGLGDKASVILKGSEYSQITWGDYSKIMYKGDYYEELFRGDKTSIMDKGDHLFQIRFGNQKVQLIKGDQMVNVVLGNQTLEIDKGNQSTLLLMGDRDVSLMWGNESNFINGNFSEVVTKNYDLVVEQDLRIFVMGKTSITSLGNIDITTPQSMNFVAGQDINMTAGMNIDQTAGMNITELAGISIEETAGMDINMVGTNNSVEMSAAIELTAGTTIAISAGVTITQEAPLIFLN